MTPELSVLVVVVASNVSSGGGQEVPWKTQCRGFPQDPTIGPQHCEASFRLGFTFTLNYLLKFGGFLVGKQCRIEGFKFKLPLHMAVEISPGLGHNLFQPILSGTMY